MQLDELKLNRFGYKANVAPIDSDPVYMSSQNASSKNVSAKNGVEVSKKDAKEIITGTVITACLIKSSDQDDRIEIGQNLATVLDSNDIGSLDFAHAIGLDYLVAYRPGNRIGFLLTGIGFTYIGYGMPAAKTISLIDGQTLVLQTTSEHLWTMTQLGTGVYRITHNLGSKQLAISVIGTTTGNLVVYALAYITNKGLNSFVVNMFDLTGTPVNSDFDCIVEVFN